MHKKQIGKVERRSMKQNNGKGFTIIEVVLVLAIASLIFLMVFIALPALQRSQRDASLKSEASKVLSELTTYQGSNKQAWPLTTADGAKAFVSYIDATDNPASATWPLHLSGGTTVENATFATMPVPAPAASTIQIVSGAKCPTSPVAGSSDNGQNALVSSSRNAAVVIQTEAGTTTSYTTYFCQNS